MSRPIPGSVVPEEVHVSGYHERVADPEFRRAVFDGRLAGVWADTFIPIPDADRAYESLSSHEAHVAHDLPLGRLIETAGIDYVHSNIDVDYQPKPSLDGPVPTDADVTNERFMRIRFSRAVSVKEADDIAAARGARLARPEDLIAAAGQLKGKFRMRNLLAPGHLFEGGIVGTSSGHCTALYLDEQEDGRLYLMTHDVVSRTHPRIEPFFDILVVCEKE